MRNVSVKNLKWLLLAGAVVLLDQVTKHLVIMHLSTSEPWVLLPNLNFILSYNAGAAWNFLSDASGWQRWFFCGIALLVSGVIIVWIMRLTAKELGMALALSLILGGALGNLWDRIDYGYVIDFIQVHAGQWYFPSFNVADSAITVGAIILIFISFIYQGEKIHEKSF